MGGNAGLYDLDGTGAFWFSYEVMRAAICFSAWVELCILRAGEGVSRCNFCFSLCTPHTIVNWTLLCRSI